MFSEKLHSTITYYLIILLSLCIPLSRVVSVYIIGLIILNWFLEARFVKRFIIVRKSFRRKDILLFGLLYINYLIGLLYTSNLDYGLFSVQVKASLIIFPILFATFNIEFWNINKTITVLIAFLVGSFSSSIISLINATISYYFSSDPTDFYYASLSIFHHPSYSALYMTFSIAILIGFVLDSRIKLRKWLLILAIMFVVYFHVYTVMLSSKAGILALILIFFITVSYVIFVNRRYILGSFLIVAITFLFIVVLNFFPYSSMRFNPSREILQNEKDISNETTDGTVERVLIWKYSFELINEHFFFGVGTGDVINALLEVYDDHEFNDALEKELNPHNQYLQTFISLGVVGFLILIFSLILPAIYSARHKGFIYFCFLVIVAFNFLVESMLERQAGVVFYAFFNSFLFMLYLPGRKLD